MAGDKITVTGADRSVAGLIASVPEAPDVGLDEPPGVVCLAAHRVVPQSCRGCRRPLR